MYKIISVRKDKYYFFKEEFIMEDRRYNSLSKMGKDFVKREKKELGNYDLIKEITVEQAKKLGGYSGELVAGLETYTNEKSSPEDKVKALKVIKAGYAKVVGFARKFKEYFEARKVFLMCEAKMISAKIDSAKLNEEIREAEAGIEENEG